MGKRRWGAILPVLGVLILVVAACAPAATPTPTATATPPPVVATPTPTAATPTPVAGMPVGYGYSEFGEWGMPLNMPPPQYGGIFREGTTSSPPHYDSHRTYSEGVVRFTALIFDPLIRFSPYMDVDIMPDTYREEYLAPNLAEKWEVSQDGLAVTFYLKRGVKWHDGAPFTAKDVKYSLDKLLDPNQSTFTGGLAMVDRVEVVDDYSVKVYLKYPATRLFLLTLGMNQLAIQAQHLKDVSYRTTSFMIGTGPFKLKSYTAGIIFETQKNPDYHFKGRPYFDGMRQHIFGTSSANCEAVAAGQIDFAPCATETSEEVLRRVAPEVVLRYDQKLNADNNVWLSFVKEGPWQDVRVRKALSMVIDRPGLCVAVYGKLAGKLCNPRGGYFVSAPAGRGLPFEEYEKTWLLDRPIEERVAAAKKLLTEAGYPNGFRAEWMLTGTGAGARELVVMDTWRRLLNIDSVARIVPSAQLLDLGGRGEFEVWFRSNVAFVGAMEQLVSANFIKGGESNWGKYYHPLVEELYPKLLKERDFDKAVSILHQIERLLLTDVPAVSTYIWNTGFAYWPYVTPRFFYHPVYHSHYNGVFTVVWLDQNHPSWAKRAK